MGSSGSKSHKLSSPYAGVEQAKFDQVQEYLKSRAAEQAAWDAQQQLEKHHRELRLQEEEKLKREREAWLREENLKEKQQQEEILRQQEDRAQRLLREKKQWDERQVHQEVLLQKSLSSTQPNVSAATPNHRTEVTNEKKFRPRVKKTVANSKVQPSQPTIPPLIPAPRTASSSSECVKASGSVSYAALYASPQFPFVEWTEIDYVREKHGVSKYVAENIIAMFDRNDAIAFIARYRKNTTLGMDVDQLRNVKESLRQARLLKQKADSFVAKTHERGICNAQLYALVRSTKSLRDFEFIESIYESPKPELEKAKRLGLLVPAEAILKGNSCRPLSHYAISHCEDFKSEHLVRSAVVSLIADVICKEPKTLERMKILRKKHAALIATEKYKDGKENGRTRSKKIDYRAYHNFSAFEKSLKPHQVAEINRGEAQKIIYVRVVFPEQFEKDFKEYCAREYADARKTSDLHQSIFMAAFDFAWKSTIESHISKLTRQELTRRAETALVADIAKNAKQLLLVPPLRNKIVMGIQPGIEGGCVLAVVSGQGQVLRMETLHPHDPGNPSAKHEAEIALEAIIKEHQCFTVALGDGPACRETEIFLTDLIEKRSLGIAYAIVDNAPATFYASSQQSSTDFPFLETKFKAAVSLAKRLQDPMAELVKIDPRQWNMKIPQHNLPAKQLIPQLNAAIEEAVSLVGVDVNTGSLSLLKRVAGLNESKAKNLIKWRESSGPFRTRNDLKKVAGICDKTFEQCAAFLRIVPETAVGKDQAAAAAFNYLDQTCIHPEMYDVAEAFLRSIGCDRIQKLGSPSFITKVSDSTNSGYSALASKFYTSVEIMKIIVEGLLMEKDFDVRGKAADQLVFRKSLKNLDDLVIGTVLTGVVRGNAHFGSFVDVGLEIQGLIHKSKTGGVTLYIGQKVEATVIKFDKERRRLGLALVKCL